MAREDREESPGVDPEVARIHVKAARGLLSIAEAALEDPEVKRIIRRIALLEGLRMGAILALMFSGISMVLGCLQSMAGSPLAGLAAGIALILASLAVAARELRCRSPRRSKSLSGMSR